MSPGSANWARASMSIRPICAVFAASSNCFKQPVDGFQFFLDLERVGHGERRLAGEFVLAGQLVDLVLVAQPVDQLHDLPGKRRAIVADADTRRAPTRGFALPRMPARIACAAASAARSLSPNSRYDLSWPRLERCRFRRLREFSASARFSSGHQRFEARARGRRFGSDRAARPGPAPRRSARA